MNAKYSLCILKKNNHLKRFSTEAGGDFPLQSGPAENDSYNVFKIW